MDYDERKLIELAQQGDVRAFEKLVRKHDRRVLQLAYSMLDNLHDAQDVYQETFLRAFSKLGGYRFESSFATWLCRIAIHLSINIRRTRKRKSWLSIHDRSDAQLHAEVLDQQRAVNSAEQDVLDGEFFAHLRKNLNKLSPQERAAFSLKHFHGYKISEIADIMSCAEGTIKSYLFRATKKLRRALLPYFAGK